MTDRYTNLYENMRKRFTVENNGSEYTLGEYMTLKATHSDKITNLPVARASKGEGALVNILSYVNDKLTIKAPPVKDKTIRAFPLRTSLSAFLSAAVACSFVLCFAVIGARIINFATPTAEKASVTEYAPEVEEEILEYNL